MTVAQSDTVGSAQKRDVLIIYSDSTSSEYQTLLSIAGVDILKDEEKSCMKDFK